VYSPGPSRGTPYAPPSPPPEEAGTDSSASPRYSYLVGRLRNRQITMEEATELFALQRQQVRALQNRVNAIVSQAAPPPPPPGVPPAPGAASAAAPSLSGDYLAEGLLFLGIGAGLLAALLKRMQTGPAAPDPPADARSDPAPGSRGRSRRPS
jgi:hypothetical protein